MQDKTYIMRTDEYETYTDPKLQINSNLRLKSSKDSSSEESKNFKAKNPKSRFTQFNKKNKGKDKN